MWYQAVLIPYLIYPTCCHVPKNNSDVIVTYAGHAEAEPVREMKPATEIPETTTIKQRYIERLDIEEHTETSTPFFEETEGVMFIPNEKPVNRNDDEYLENKVNIADVLYGRSVDDVMRSKSIRVETDSSTNKDVLFLTGKNNENQNIDKPKRREFPTDDNVQTRRSGNGIHFIKLDCTNLDCNNTLKSVCGGKMEHKKMRYRLFLNECFFRKVNCLFKYEENRFREVPKEHCSQTAAHYSERPFVYKPRQQLPQMKPANVLNARKSTASRRSLNLDLNGKFCSHPCPASCSEQYEPECAMSSKGQRRVFVNHCKLDYNSCSYGAVWYRRPLAECVGGKKADLTRNSAFIGWMQRVGIVDSKGRLSLS